jgi:hypothetical protein
MNANLNKTESKSRETDTELTDAELEKATGGRGVLDTIVDAYLAAVGKNLMDAIHPPQSKKTMTMHMR